MLYRLEANGQKQHDGFCLFDSAFTDYKATNTPAKRDLIREYLEAFREEGLKVGLYYSLLDWHHPDYPAYGHLHHPMRENPNFAQQKIDFSNYIRYFHNQVRELLSNYGTIDLMWFDFSYEDMKGEKWEASLTILEEVGEWMSKNGESIYGCTHAELPKPEWGYYTQKDTILYAHVFERGIGPILLEGCKEKLSKARLLSDGSEVNIAVPWNGHDFPKDAFLNIVGLNLPDEDASVYQLTLK